MELGSEQLGSGRTRMTATSYEHKRALTKKPKNSVLERKKKLCFRKKEKKEQCYSVLEKRKRKRNDGFFFE